jgi:prophage maintenance system killer protein
VTIYPTAQDVIADERVVLGQALIDGKQAVAVTVTAAFLKVNGYRLDFADDAAFSFLIELYESGRMRFSELELWLRAHAAPK